MQCVKTSQKRHRVLTGMDRVDQKAEQEETRDEAYQWIANRPEGQADPKGGRECGRNVSVGAKINATSTMLSSQIPRLPSRLRNAGNSRRRRRRGWRSSQMAIASRLPRITTCVSGTSSCVLISAHAESELNGASHPLSEPRAYTRGHARKCRREKRLTIGRDGIIRADGGDQGLFAERLLTARLSRCGRLQRRCLLRTDSGRWAWPREPRRQVNPIFLCTTDPSSEPSEEQDGGEDDDLIAPAAAAGREHAGRSGRWKTADGGKPCDAR